MNPIIFYAPLNGGVLTVPLGNACNCLIGLASIQFPCTNRRGSDFREINIICDQIDSSMSNRKRLLQRVCFDNDSVGSFYSRFEFTNILYFPIDSSDNKLTIRLHDQEGAVVFPEKVGRHKNAEIVTVCLNVIPLDGAKARWGSYI